MPFVEKTVEEIQALSRADKKAWLEGDGAPVKPTGYDDLAVDDGARLAYDASAATTAAQIAGVVDAIANAD
jgi:hypothetical protein